MERLNELENKIVEEYTDKLLDRIRIGIENLNLNIGKNILNSAINEIILDHLRNSGSQFSLNSYVNDGVDIRLKLFPLVKSAAIKEFMDKYNEKI